MSSLHLWNLALFLTRSARSNSRSLATRAEADSPCRASSNWQVLLPGALHKSRALWPGRTSKAQAGSIERVSCTTTSPVFLEAFCDRNLEDPAKFFDLFWIHLHMFYHVLCMAWNMAVSNCHGQVPLETDKALASFIELIFKKPRVAFLGHTTNHPVFGKPGLALAQYDL